MILHQLSGHYPCLLVARSPAIFCAVPSSFSLFWCWTITLACFCAMRLSLFVWTLPLFVGGTQPCHFLCHAKLQCTKPYCWLISSTSIMIWPLADILFFQFSSSFLKPPQNTLFIHRNLYFFLKPPQNTLFIHRNLNFFIKPPQNTLFIHRNLYFFWPSSNHVVYFWYFKHFFF